MSDEIPPTTNHEPGTTNRFFVPGSSLAIDLSRGDRYCAGHRAAPHLASAAGATMLALQQLALALETGPWGADTAAGAKRLMAAVGETHAAVATLAREAAHTPGGQPL